MVGISKKDWKLLRERVPQWQERYKECLTKEYIRLLSAEGNASDHFWELEERIKRDKKQPDVFLSLIAVYSIWVAGAEVVCVSVRGGMWIKGWIKGCINRKIPVYVKISMKKRIGWKTINTVLPATKSYPQNKNLNFVIFHNDFFNL